MTGFEGVSDEEVLATYADTSLGRGRREAAFGELVSRYERRVYGITFRYFGNHSDAQDATQDTFVQLARKADQFRGDSKLSTWIYRVATNACNDLGRKMARRPQLAVEDVDDHREGAGDEAPTEDLLAGREMALEIQRALLQLDDLSRQLIILCAIEGQSYAEVSEALDLPVGTIKSRVFRARARLAELLAPVLDPDEGSPTVVDRSPAGAEPDGSASPRGPPA